ncbi:MAG: Asp-tRNA(Asn)/Glu-tRNA(Gln) amidotransferase subunit GatB, partial [Oscillibacter sp.]|nr:Asp-tRNA(Asn)/Glu-tRNA(Gln) amidotransferase subunit GatB [Oscillibacter sp.]
YEAKGLSAKEIASLTSERSLCDLFDAVTALGCEPKDAASWILTECGGLLRKHGQVMGELRIAPERLSRIMEKVSGNEINRAAGRKVLEAVLYEDADPDAYCEAHNLSAQGDADAVRQVVLKVLDSTPNAVKDYLGGKKKAFQALFGGCMKELKGNGDPQVIRALLEEELSKRS